MFGINFYADIIIHDHVISHSSIKDPSKVDWASTNIDILIEASGKFRTKESLQTYFDHGV